MGYERFPRGDDPQRGAYGRDDYGDRGQDQRDRFGTENRGWTSQDRQYAGGDRDAWRGQDFAGGSDYYRAEQTQRSGQYGGQYGRDPYRQQRGTFDRQPQGYGNEDRGFIQRAGDEVRSWFGDEDAERRREADARRDEQYRSWRDQHIAGLDRDYDEYRQQNQAKSHNEFTSWRTERQGQRDLLNTVEEHAEVVGSDGEHVGTVDKVRGDRIILTKSDADAGGRHHSIPSSWLQAADAGKVTLRKTAAEAKQHWRDEERSGALFGQDDQRRSNEDGSDATGAKLNRSFSGTY